jgi:tetratricopeptide (TPR) repeat protein
LYFDGRWDDAIGRVDELIADFVEHPFWMEPASRRLRGRMRLARGDSTGAEADAERALELARVAKDPQTLWPALAFGARVFVVADRRRAGDLAAELLPHGAAQRLVGGSESEWLADLAVVFPLLGREAELLERIRHAGVSTPWRNAATAYLSGDFRGAADTYASMGALPEEAYARLRAAEALVKEGRRSEADTELQRALAFWRSVGATAYVREGEALLAAAG